MLVRWSMGLEREWHLLCATNPQMRLFELLVLFQAKSRICTHGPTLLPVEIAEQ